MTIRLLIAESEPAEARAKRRASVGRSSGESMMDVLREVAPSALLQRIAPADAESELAPREALEGYDAIFLTGSPLHLYEDTPEARRQIAFMRAVFSSGTPSFGSCAGLQVATVAAGGKVRPGAKGQEAGFARRIFPTQTGMAHPLLRGRPAAFDALSVHTDEVDVLPDAAMLLASNAVTHVQAAEIRHQGGIFWGVQYHPELDLDQVAAALERQASDLIERNMAHGEGEVSTYAEDLRKLHRQPDRIDLRWRLGVDPDVLTPATRRRELHNFIDHLVLPTRSARGRS